MTLHQLTILYSDNLLLSLKMDKDIFEQEACLLLAVKLYEQGRISTGMAAQLAGLERVAFMFALHRFGLSPIGTDPDELLADVANA